MVKLNVQELAKDLLAGQRRALAKAITLVESQLASDRNLAVTLIDLVLKSSGKSMRIGITGSPGVGKSSFVEALGNYLVSQGKKIAVLAIDPSSPVSGGSILGDKTRMEKLSQEENAFIRPSPTRGTLGGVGSFTRESIILCEAAGFEIIFVETVGVGQSEIDVSRMVDLSIMLLLPNAGDELQGIKKGIVEMADLILVTKADGQSLPAAQATQLQYQNARALVRQTSNKNGASDDQVLLSSIFQAESIVRNWQRIQSLHQTLDVSNLRNQQNLDWFQKLLNEKLLSAIHTDPKLQKIVEQNEMDVRENRSVVTAAVQKAVRAILGN